MVVVETRSRLVHSLVVHRSFVDRHSSAGLHSLVVDRCRQENSNFARQSAD